MKNLRVIMFFVTALVVIVPTTARAFNIFDKEDKQLDIGVRGQVFGFAEMVDDPDRYDTRLYLFLKQARFNVNGRVEDFSYHLQVAFGGEEEVRDKNASLSLLDLSFDVPLTEKLRFKIGQFNVPYGRERITNSEHLIFADRSVQNLGFRVGRDVGGALHGYYDNDLSFAVGVFTGGGRDVPLRFLPQSLGIPLVVGRIGMDTGVDEDIFNLKQNIFRPEATRWAFFINGFYMKDSRIGHKTVLNVKTTEKSLLIDSDWNPFMAINDRGDFVQAGADFVIRVPLSSGSLSAELEGNFGLYQNKSGRTSLIGARGQASYFRAPFEVALRYSFLRPDSDFSNGGVSITGNTLIHEITPAGSFYFMDHHAKIILDFPILVNVPVVREVGIGSYVLTEQISQAALLATGGTISKKTVPQARLLIQVSF